MAELLFHFVISTFNNFQLLLQNTADDISDILEMSEEFSLNSSRRFSSQPDLVNFTNNYASTHLHSQSLNNVNIAVQPVALTCNNSITKSLNSRPASILLASTEGKFKFPVLKICPSTPTPSESESSASQLSPHCSKMLDVYSNTSNSLFAFTPPIKKDSASLMPTSSCRCSKHFNASLVSFHYSDINLGLIGKNTNCNAKKSLLVPFTSNADIFNITAKSHEHPNHHHHRQQHLGQHRSLNEINGGSSCSSKNNSPYLRSSVSPNTSQMDETVTSGNVFAGGPQTVANRSKISPTPSRTCAVATPISLQSQSDSLSSATTISTATTIIPKEVGEMARRSSDSDLSVTPKGMLKI